VLIDISTATLRKMVKLSERKEALMSEIQRLDREMAALQRGSEMQAKRSGSNRALSVSTSRSQRGRANSGRAKRGALKESIIELLRSAGKTGRSIRELSEQLGVKTANLYVWFNGTGKNIPGIRKIGPATYRLNE
jgi:transposase-like protein